MENVKSENGEAWEEIPGYEGLYSVSNLGRVRRDAGGKGAQAERILKPWGNGGWFYVTLCKDGKRRELLVHRLVMLAFAGPCPEGMEVCHGDGNPANNRLDNLRYDTHSENHLDIHRQGRKRGHQVLTIEQVAKIRNLLDAGERQESVALRFGVTQATISGIKTGRRWSHRLDQTLLQNQESELCTNL